MEQVTRHEQEELLRRYFAGEMNVTEEQDFFVHVALDDELRRMLKAHLIVRSTLEAERVTEPMDHHNGRARLVAALAAELPLPPAESKRPMGNTLRWLIGSFIIVISLSVLLISIYSNQQTESIRSSGIVSVAEDTVKGSSTEREAVIVPSSAVEQRAKSRRFKMGGSKIDAHVSDQRITVEREGALKAAAMRDTSSPEMPQSTFGKVVPSGGDTIRAQSHDTVMLRLRVKKVKE